MKLMPSLTMLALIGCAKNTNVETPVPAPVMEAVSAVVTSPNDDREYLYFELDNGLRVMAISDPNTDSAAAALDVHIGQFSDPFDRQGLSHFLEHMLFMGTEKYPDVDGYRKFIQDHGGGSNAGTGQEHTTYFFNIDQPYLEPALDRFAQFFIAPKLDPEYVDRERNAVNAEYSLKIKDEARRNREVRRVTHNPDHPFRKFSVGNLETLGDRDGDLVWDDLKTHYEATYSASRMAMSVIGREDVNTLKAMVIEKMSAVPSDGKRKQYSKVTPFLPEQLGVRIQVTPLQDVRSIEMTFPGPRADEYWAEHPLEFVTHLMGQEGEGSLHSLLKSRGWIEDLYSYGTGTEDYASVVVGADLTEEGYQHIDDIVDLTFQYARLVAKDGVKAAYHNERAQIAALGFQFSSERSPSSAVRQARLLQSYPPEHFNNVEAVYGDFDADLVNVYLDAMVPRNLRLFVHGPNLETDQTEPLYGTPYSIRPLDPALMARWQSSETDPALTLPEANPFIADDVSLREADEADVPKQLLDEPGLSLWHDQDVEFGMPHTRAVIELHYPVADTRAQVINSLMVDLINDSLETWRFQPSQAGVYASVRSQERGIELSLSGYNE
ncbi:MAG: peptidase M16, partial [Rhodobacterales bacterium]|nr:peptidase M16 [Rhodobacterales bacterium]